jgi:NhaP-type Na+/H+ or K+/H+ antiporter
VSDAPFYHAALAVSAGMAGQVVAARFAVPSIVILLLIGVVLGPDVLALLNPTLFGPALSDLVSLAVSVILFEGGLALRVEDLRRQQRSLTLLLTVGALISMLFGTWSAHAVLGMSWSIALLYGSLMIVTGPTVVTPLLTRLTVDRSVKELLISEGVLIDPIGAMVAILASEYVMGHSAVWETGWLLFVRLAVGGAIGAGCGIVLTFVLRRDWIPEGLRNPSVLGAVLLAAGAASRVSPEAGLMSAVVQGVVMANTGLREIGRLRQFKEELTVFLLSFIFVLLAADLPLGAVRALGWEALLVVAILIWVARPLAVFLCTVGSGLTLQQRLFISWICPRGIVAASVAGLFAILLESEQIEGGNRLEALVFVTVGATVILQGFTAGFVARLLKLDLPSLRGTIIVGADHFGRLLARLLTAYGRQVALIDLNPQYCRAARAAGLSVYNGDALSADDLEEAGARYADTVLAVTRNQELNTLICQRVKENFRVERVLALSEGKAAEAGSNPFPGAFPGVDEVNRLLRLGKVRLVEYELTRQEVMGRTLNQLPFADEEWALLLQRRENIYIATADQVVAAGDHLICLKTSSGTGALGELGRVVREGEARKTAGVVEARAAEG